MQILRKRRPSVAPHPPRYCEDQSKVETNTLPKCPESSLFSRKKFSQQGYIRVLYIAMAVDIAVVETFLEALRQHDLYS